jgi:DNA mismatch endonuclease, patch repair protein
MDIFTRKKRSWIMGRIRSKNTKPEIIVRSILHRTGFRFSLGRKRLPGSPDIVLPKHRTAIFVHGCFWHRHRGCKVATTPKSRVGFWKSKFERNVERDRKNIRELRKLGWTVIVVWECQAMGDPERLGKMLFDRMTGLSGDVRKPANRRQVSFTYGIPEKGELLKIAEKRADYSRLPFGN